MLPDLLTTTTPATDSILSSVDAATALGEDDVAGRDLAVMQATDILEEETQRTFRVATFKVRSTTWPNDASDPLHLLRVVGEVDVLDIVVAPAIVFDYLTPMKTVYGGDLPSVWWDLPEPEGFEHLEVTYRPATPLQGLGLARAAVRSLAQRIMERPSSVEEARFKESAAFRSVVRSLKRGRLL